MFRNILHCNLFGLHTTTTNNQNWLLLVVVGGPKSCLLVVKFSCDVLEVPGTPKVALIFALLSVGNASIIDKIKIQGFDLQ